MGYERLGLAALVRDAIRAAVADPEQQQQVDEQGAAIAAVRERFDALNSRVGEIATALESNTSGDAANATADAERAEALAGIRSELEELALALTGPADDDTDGGLIAEVQPVEEVQPSPAADSIQDAADDI